VRARRVGALAALAWALVLAAGAAGAQAPARPAAREAPRFEVRFPASLRATPVTGRLFVALFWRDDLEPRAAAYQSARTRVGRVPFFAVDVEQLAPGRWAVVDTGAVGYPYWSLRDLPPGEYRAQAVLNVYTRYPRADGHVVWAHQDQWEGQRWAHAPGNLVSTPVRVTVDPARGFRVRLELDHVLPPVQVPPDTRWVKRFRIQSPMLTRFWGHPQYLGATVLLPRGYDEHPERRYPVLYVQGHFSLDPPFGFTEDSTPPPPAPVLAPGADPRSNVESGRPWGGGGRRESGYAFQQAWVRDSFPRMIVVTLQHPTPYFDDSYAVNSANAGPYGDAIVRALVPEVERRFRAIASPYARVLTGGSTGGWASLALQVQHPDRFGGTWTFYPDPVDFRRYQLVDIYRDSNAFTVPNAPPGAPERMMQMTPEGQPVGSMRAVSQMELASGTRGRSGAQIDVWNATYGPVGADGYPRRLWDLRTGAIDPAVAAYMRERGYDLREYLRRYWPRVGPSLVGKLHLLTGDMDDFYLAPSVYLLEEFLESTRAPYYAGSFRYGRPMKGHGWQPMTNAGLVREIAAHVARNAPPGDDPAGWLDGAQPFDPRDVVGLWQLVAVRDPRTGAVDSVGARRTTWLMVDSARWTYTWMDRGGAPPGAPNVAANGAPAPGGAPRFWASAGEYRIVGREFRIRRVMSIDPAQAAAESVDEIVRLDRDTYVYRSRPGPGGAAREYVHRRVE
jgi:hypothetical protein